MSVNPDRAAVRAAGGGRRAAGMTGGGPGAGRFMPRR